MNLMMESFNRKSHWENIYQTKLLNEVSWFQPKPDTSLNFIHEFNMSKSAKVIDVGGGDSFLVDHLLDLGFENLTVLDISEAAIERAKERLGSKSDKVKWIVSDVLNFLPEEKYDFWHDRAAFHFLTDEQDVQLYLQTAQQSIDSSGVLVIGTFSEQGPTKCSGIPIKQYSEVMLTALFETYFEKVGCLIVDHNTPFDTIQNFVFCSFRKI